MTVQSDSWVRKQNFSKLMLSRDSRYRGFVRIDCFRLKVTKTRWPRHKHLWWLVRKGCSGIWWDHTKTIQKRLSHVDSEKPLWLTWQKSNSIKVHNWTASSEFGTYRLCEQRRFRRVCASAQSRQNLPCSLIQAVKQEEPSDRKPDPWPSWLAGHTHLKFVMTECSKTQIRLKGG